MPALVTRRLTLVPVVAEARDGGIVRPAELPSWVMLAFLADGVKVGEGGLLFDEDGEVHLGYRIAPPFRRQGFAVEGLRAVVGLAFADLGAARLVAETAFDNVASRQTLARLDFSPGGETTSRWSERRQRYIDYQYYRLDKADWTGGT